AREPEPPRSRRRQTAHDVSQGCLGPCAARRPEAETREHCARVRGPAAPRPLKEKERRKLRTRATLLFWGLFAVSSLLGARLYKVQVSEGAALAAGAGLEQQATFDVSGRRGDIVDRFGVPFATS